MANIRRYTQEALYSAAKIIKRSIKNEITKGKRVHFTKTEALVMLSNKLELASPRSLWKGKNRDYIDKWYQELDLEIKELLNNNEAVKIKDSIISSSEEFELLNKLKQKQEYITVLEKKIKELSVENEDLRNAYNGRYTIIDLD